MALEVEMSAQAAQPSWQLPMLPPDTAGGAAPGETGLENTRGVVSFPVPSPGWQRGTTRLEGNTSARASGLRAEGAGELAGTLLYWGDIVGGVGALQWGLQKRCCCGVRVETLALSMQPALQWRQMNTAPAVMEV